MGHPESCCDIRECHRTQREAVGVPDRYDCGMSFRISGLPADRFSHLAGCDEATLRAQGIEPTIVDAKPGFPDRISLRDLEVGERALLLNYTHLDAATPYRASHAIFIAATPTASFDAIDAVPEALRSRTLSLRAFDEAGMMRDADLVDGTAIESLIARLFADPKTAFVHAHFAKRGCFAARIDRP